MNRSSDDAQIKFSYSLIEVIRCTISHTKQNESPSIYKLRSISTSILFKTTVIEWSEKETFTYSSPFHVNIICRTMLIWKRMENIKSTEASYESEEVLLRVEEMCTKLRETIKMRKTRWIGHVLRRTDERCA